MTVCVAVKVYDCIVFAADSASSLIGNDPITGAATIANVYAHGIKVFNLRKGLPIAAMTCGMGNIGAMSIGTLAKELRERYTNGDENWRLGDGYTMEEVAEKARRFFFEEHYQALADKPAGDHELQFWLGGNGAKETHGEIWRITILNGVCNPPELVAGQGDFKISYAGQPEAINRIVSGYSQELPRALIDAGLRPENLGPMLAHIESRTYAPLISPAMPVTDAIALADFLVETTKQFVRFLPGADTVGGETDICVVNKHEGFKWVRRKHHFSATLNPGGL